MSLKSDFRTTINGVDKKYNVFETWSGGDGTAAAVKWRPGGSTRETQRGGNVTFSDIKISRTWNPKVDQPFLDLMRNQVGLGLFQLSKQNLDARGAAIGSPELWNNCLLIGVVAPEAESGSDDRGMIELTFSTTGPNSFKR